MKIIKTKHGFRLHFLDLERLLLEQIFKTIVSNYESDAGKMDARVRKLWYDPSGLVGPGFEHERSHWEELLQTTRSERCETVKSWIRSLEKKVSGNSAALTLSLDEAEILLMVLNDHRLAVAALADIEEKDMERPFRSVPEGPKNTALFVIDFLGDLQAFLIQKISGSMNENP